jgi:hypothetical protein
LTISRPLHYAESIRDKEGEKIFLLKGGPKKASLYLSDQKPNRQKNQADKKQKQPEAGTDNNGVKEQPKGKRITL